MLLILLVCLELGIIHSYQVIVYRTCIFDPGVWFSCIDKHCYTALLTGGSQAAWPTAVWRQFLSELPESWKCYLLLLRVRDRRHCTTQLIADTPELIMISCQTLYWRKYYLLGLLWWGELLFIIFTVCATGVHTVFTWRRFDLYLYDFKPPVKQIVQDFCKFFKNQKT